MKRSNIIKSLRQFDNIQPKNDVVTIFDVYIYILIETLIEARSIGRVGLSATAVVVVVVAAAAAISSR